VTDRGAYQAEKYLKLMVILYFLIRCVRTPGQYQLVILAWLLGVAYLGYQGSGGAGRMIGGRLTSGLGGPDFSDSSDLAVHLVATLPLIGALFFMARTWLGRGLLLATGALTVNLIIMTRTRNVLVGLAAIALAVVLSLPRGYRVKGLAAVVVGTLLATQLADPRWWDRMQTIAEYQQDASATNRLLYWRAAVQMALDYPLGIGLGNFHTTVMDYVPGLTMVRSAHNTVLACLAELGWAGLAVFLTLVGVVLRRLSHIRRQARDLPAQLDIYRPPWHTPFHLGWHAVALRAALFGYLVCAMFTTRLFAEDFWLLLGLAMCLHNVTKHIAAQTRQTTDDRGETVPATIVPTALPASPAGSAEEVRHAAAAK